MQCFENMLTKKMEKKKHLKVEWQGPIKRSRRKLFTLWASNKRSFLISAMTHNITEKQKSKGNSHI